MQITIPGGLFGAGGFDLVALQRQAEERGRAEREYQAAEAAKLAALKEEVAERNRLQAEADAAKAAQVQPANISTYYDALRTGEDTSQFDDILQSTLAEQDYITSGFDMAEAGAYAVPVDDRFIVPGGIDTSNVGEFTFDKTLEDFEGYDFDYGNISNENLKKFQEELMPAMAPAVAQAQLEGQSYQNALIQAYERSPEVQEIYAKYDISPQRISKKYGSEYLYDPFTFSEIQTVDRSPGTSELVKGIGTSLFGAALLGPLASSLTSSAPLQGALTGAGVSAATGGDPLTGALTGGLTAGIDPFITGADLGTAGTAIARGATSAAIAEATGGDPLTAGLVTAGVSYIGDTVAQRRAEGTTVAEEIGLELPEDVVTSIENKIGEAIDFTSGGEISEIVDDLTPTYEVLDKIIEDVGIDTFNTMSNLDVYNYLQEAGDISGSNILGIDPSAYQRTVGFFQRDPGLRSDLTLESSATAGTSFAPDIFGGTETTVVPFDPSTSTTVNVDVSELRDPRLSLAEIRAGGGGGGAPVTEITAPAMTSTFAPTSAPSMTMPSVTPAIAPPSTFSSGSLAGATILPIAGLMASAATAPTSSVATTGGGATTPAGGQISGQADSTETAGEGQVGTDTAGTEVTGGGAGGSGGGTGTGTGVGVGTGTGSGTGSGDGSGDGEGTGAGFGSGTSITELVFSDFINPYRSQPLLEYATTLPGYEAPLDIFRRTI